MPFYSLLTELDRKVILFSQEKHAQGQSHLSSHLLNEEYRAFIITEGEYILWELEKRKLTEQEVLAHSWMVTSTQNISLMFHFKTHNQVTISSLFDDQQCAGLWQLEHGILKVRFIYQRHGYDISIIANNNQSIHSALQIVDNKSVDLLKLAPVMQACAGQGLLE